MRTVAPRSGVNQLLTYPGHRKIVGVIWHMMHAADMLSCSGAYWFNCEAAWCSGLELSPSDSWETIAKKSFDRRHQWVALDD